MTTALHYETLIARLKLFVSNFVGFFLVSCASTFPSASEHFIYLSSNVLEKAKNHKAILVTPLYACLHVVDNETVRYPKLIDIAISVSIHSLPVALKVCSLCTAKPAELGKGGSKFGMGPTLYLG